MHPKTKEEYALARIERKTKKGYKGFEFDISSNITLKQDLFRRDLTINAMAKKGDQIIDYFDGKKDLKNGILRHVSSAFNEDPVRVLRVARFAAKFEKLGFVIAHKTYELMQQMVISGEVDALVPERIFKELDKALSYETPSVFFVVLLNCNAFAKVFPFVKNSSSKFKFLDYLDTKKNYIKFSIWLKDEDCNNIESLCEFIKCPKKYKELALLTSKYNIFANNFDKQNSESIFNFFVKTDAFRRKNRFYDLLATFKLLKIDTSQIIKLFNLIENIDVSKLKTNDIGTAITVKKKNIIKSFLNTT